MCKVCRQNPAERSRFIWCIYMLLNSNSPAVRYEAGVCLSLFRVHEDDLEDLCKTKHLCMYVCVCVCVCDTSLRVCG